MIRIVKMTFKPEKIDEFLSLFNEKKNQIRNFKGINHLELWRDSNQPNIFFTYSHWKTADDLEKYRNSDLFKNIWSKTKPLFIENAEAWSVDSIVQVNPTL